MINLDHPLTDGASSDEIRAAAGRERQGAAELEHQAARDEAEAGDIRAALRAEIARLETAAEAKAAPLAASASAARNEAGAGAECARLLDGAAALAEAAEAADARVKALEDERADLDQRQSALGQRLAELAARRRDLGPQLAAALDGDDEKLITDLRTELDTAAAREVRLREQQAPLITRLHELGDGEMKPIWPQLELAEARRVADPARQQVRRALNYALPDRPEAVADRAREHAEALDRMASDELAAERAKRPPQQQVVHL